MLEPSVLAPPPDDWKRVSHYGIRPEFPRRTLPVCWKRVPHRKICSLSPWKI